MRTQINSVRSRQVWDSRGRPTVEVEVTLAAGAVGRAIAPAGASRGIHEAIDLRDGGRRFGGSGVDTAVRNVTELIAPALTGHDSCDQKGIDEMLVSLDGTPNKSRLGGNAMVATSMAVLHAAAQASGLPLWKHLAGVRDVRLPVPEVQIFGGGAHAGRRVDFQDFMIMAPFAGSLRRALEISAEVYRAAGELMAESGRLSGVADEGGWWPSFKGNEEALSTLVQAIERAGYKPGGDVFLSLDIASSELFRDGYYHLGLEQKALTPQEFGDMIGSWCRRYPILSVEDPLAQDDFRGLSEFSGRFPDIQVVGDDALVTSAKRIETAAKDGACNAALIKVNQAGTVSGAKEALAAAERAGWGMIVSARSGESEDVTIAHLAVGWSAGQIKVGSFARSERLAKWNELLRIEEAMGPAAHFAGLSAFAPKVATRLRAICG